MREPHHIGGQFNGFSCGFMPGSKPPEAINARSVRYCEIPICFATGCHNSCSLRMNSVVSAGDIGRAKVARSASFLPEFRVIEDGPAGPDASQECRTST
jgi:hypothetical protein